MISYLHSIDGLKYLSEWFVVLRCFLLSLSARSLFAPLSLTAIHPFLLPLLNLIGGRIRWLNFVVRAFVGWGELHLNQCFWSEAHGEVFLFKGASPDFVFIVSAFTLSYSCI